MDTQLPDSVQELTPPIVTSPVTKPDSKQPVKSMPFMCKSSRSMIVMIAVLFLTIASGATAYFINQNSIFKIPSFPITTQAPAASTPAFKTLLVASESPTTLPAPTPIPTSVSTPISSPVTLPINFTETGNLVNYDSRTESFVEDWTLLYEKPGNPAVTAKLAFSETSLCDLGEGSVSCDKSKLANGDRAKVEGNNNNGVVTVIKLIKL